MISLLATSSPGPTGPLANYMLVGRGKITRLTFLDPKSNMRWPMPRSGVKFINSKNLAQKLRKSWKLAPLDEALEEYQNRLSLISARLDCTFNFGYPIGLVVTQAYIRSIAKSQLGEAENGGCNGEVSEIIVLPQGLLQTWNLPELTQRACHAQDVLVASGQVREAEHAGNQIHSSHTKCRSSAEKSTCSWKKSKVEKIETRKRL